MVENLNLIKCHKSACKQVNLIFIILWIFFTTNIIPITPRLAGNQNVPTCPAHFMLLLKEQSWPAGPLLGATHHWQYHHHQLLSSSIVVLVEHMATDNWNVHFDRMCCKPKYRNQSLNLDSFPNPLWVARSRVDPRGRMLVINSS